jgi:acyl carrier protein
VGETQREVLAEIRRIAAEELEWRGTVEPSHRLVRDLQLDSLGLMVMAVGLENRFRIKLSEEDAQGLQTVEDLTRLVASRAHEGGAR